MRASSRPRAIGGLLFVELNLVRGSVEVAEALTVVAGRTEVGPIKNGVRRSVQVSRSLCDKLGRHLAERARQVGRPLQPDDFVFVAPEGGPLRRDLLHKRIFRPAVEAAGLAPGLRVHDYADLRVMPTSVGNPLAGRVSVLAMSA